MIHYSIVAGDTSVGLVHNASEVPLLLSSF